MKKTILLSLALVAFLGLPGLAAADTSSAPAVAAQGCNDLSFLTAAPVTSTAAAPALNPLAGVIEVQGGGCCGAKLRQCQSNCACGVFEFNCDPATCQSSCICNICP
jgi:hypothetical protein